METPLGFFYLDCTRICNVILFVDFPHKKTPKPIEAIISPTIHVPIHG